MTQKPVSQSPFAEGDTERLKRAQDVAIKSANIEDIDEALELLNEKMKDITRELAVGKINQAQFQAIYSRYREQREIIQRLKERAPESDAWQRVAAHEGITGILRKQHEALVTGVVVILNDGTKFIKKFGDVELNKEFGQHMLATVKSSQETQDASTQIDDGRWLNLVSGPYTTSIFFFSAEPSANLRERSKIIHEEFERVNRDAFASQQIVTGELEYPHQLLITA